MISSTNSTIAAFPLRFTDFFWSPSFAVDEGRYVESHGGPLAKNLFGI